MPWIYNHDRALRGAVEDVGERNGCALVVNMLDRGHDRRPGSGSDTRRRMEEFEADALRHHRTGHGHQHHRLRRVVCPNSLGK